MVEFYDKNIVRTIAMCKLAILSNLGQISTSI